MADKRVETEPDFVDLRRYHYSLTRTVEAHPDGAPDDVVARALQLTEAEVARVTEEAMAVLRDDPKVGECRECGDDLPFPQLICPPERADCIESEKA